MLYVLVLNYVAPLEAIDEALPEHRRFLDEHFTTGEFLATGPREPRIGGVIIARMRDEERVAEVIAADPFTRAGLTTYDVIPFRPTRGPFAEPLLSGNASVS
jgi:uncharacterized protein YciI